MGKKVLYPQTQIPKSKIALGTVQFGLIYGINNKSGVLDNVSLSQLLIYGFEKGIDTLDTAYNYGNSEERIGNFLSNCDKTFKIISKAPKGSNPQNIQKYFEESLGKLKSGSIYGYILHDFEDYLNNKKIINSLTDLKRSGLVKNIGFSIYYPEQLEVIFSDKIEFDLIQLPYNLADRRFEKYFEQIKNKGIEIHIRSVFLQGLFFMNSRKLPDKLKPFNQLLKTLEILSEKINRGIENISLNFVLQNKFIDKVLIGVDNIKQLKTNIMESENMLSNEEFLIVEKEILNIFLPQELLIPSNWK